MEGLENVTKFQIESLLNEVERDGIDDLMKFLENSDFYTAPASGRYHSNFKGGLAIHSLNVYNIFNKKLDEYNITYPKDTKILVPILHDLCKVNNFTIDFRGKKNKATGKWDQVPYYKTEDLFPAGHGEKSVIRLQEFMKLTKDEALMIRWHMGGYEPKENYNYLNNSWAICKAGCLLHTADLEATYLLETVKE